MPATVHHRWTAEEVRNLQDEARPWPRYELIAGELHVTPSPGFSHNRAVLELILLLAGYVRPTGVGDVLMSPSDIELEPESVLQPDVFVYPSMYPDIENPSWKNIMSLLLAVEVISPSSARTDRVQKRDQYMRTNVDEYWVIDLDGRQIERWFRNHPSVQVERTTFAWQPRGASEPLIIDLPALWKAIGLTRRL